MKINREKYHRRKEVIIKKGRVSVSFESVAAAATALGVTSCAVGFAARKGSKCQGYNVEFGKNVKVKTKYVPLDGEIFKKATYEGIEYDYTVSNKGIVLKNGQKVAQSIRNGYPNVSLFKKGFTRRIDVHRLVATLFIVNPRGDRVVNHLDEDKMNSYASNLEWTTFKGNNDHSNHKRFREVLQIDMTTNKVVGIHKSLLSAAKSIGLKSSASICECCKGKRETVKNYRRIYGKK